MLNDQRHAAFIAANRFGYGLRMGQLELISTDPTKWLQQQLHGIAKLPDVMQGVATSQTLLTEEATWRFEQNARRQRGEQRSLREALREYNRNNTQVSRAHMRLRLQTAIESQTPFAERLLRFWSNHFTIALAGGAKSILRTIAVPYENEAIRANLESDFATMLIAVQQHPAMLIYLDNDNSVGPNSQMGRRRARGLNENLAREILELHTLGVNGGYAQADVSSLARMITGWTVQRQVAEPRTGTAQESGAFRFAPAQHEPGPQTLLGRTFRDTGVTQGESVLQFLATHPATAKHIAHKLVTHFVADEPPAAAVAKIEQVFLQTRGSLPAVHAALIDLDEVWQPQYRKFKTAEELVISTARAIGVQSGRPGAPRMFASLAQALGTFNQLPFTASSPAGWPDNAQHWGSPGALLKRIDWINQIAERSAGMLDPVALYPQLLPDNETLGIAIARAESRSQGLTLLFASPEFQWR